MGLCRAPIAKAAGAARGPGARAYEEVARLKLKSAFNSGAQLSHQALSAEERRAGDFGGRRLPAGEDAVRDGSVAVLI